MANNTHDVAHLDHSIGNIMIITLLTFCGITFIFLLSLF